MAHPNMNEVSMAQQDLDIITKSSSSKAKWNEALLFKEKESIVDNSSGDAEPFELNCELSHLKQYGIGLFFYFDMMKKIAIFFVIASFICIPCMVSNGTGGNLGGTENGISQLQKLSLANQPGLKVEVPLSSSTQADRDQIQIRNDQSVKDFVEDMKNRKHGVWIPDFFYSLLFFAFIIYYKKFSYEQEKLQKKAIQPSQYSIQVGGLPPTLIDPNEIKLFFLDLFTKHLNCQDQNIIMEVAFSKDFKDTLYLHVEESLLLEEINLEKNKLEILGKSNEIPPKLIKKQAKLEQIQNKVNSIVTKELGETNSYEQYPTLSAFIVFNTFQQKQQLVDLYNKYLNPHWIYRFIPSYFAPKLPQFLLFRSIHTPIIISDVDQPSNIKWENLDVKLSNRILRKVALFFIVILIFLLTLSVLISANAVKQENVNTCPSNIYTYEQAIISPDKEVKRCYCLKLPLSEMQENEILKNYCWDNFIHNIENQLLTVLSTIVIIIVNIILQKVLIKLSKFLRYKTLTSEITTTAILLFIVTFINTGILTLLLQGNIFGFKPTVVFTSPIPPLMDTQSRKSGTLSSDFDRSWYSNVGQKVLLTMIVSTLFPHTLDLVIVPIKRWLRNKKARSRIIQSEMNNYIVGPEFNLQEQYTQFMNIIFVCLFYSSGEPLFILCAALTLTTQYWIMKYNVLRWHKKPPAYDEVLNQSMLRMLPWALFFHLGIGIYSYGQPLIFPRSSDQIKVSTSQTLNSGGVYEVTVSIDQTAPVIDRLSSTPVLFILLIIVIIFYQLDITAFTILKSLLTKIAPCLFKSQNTQVVAIKEIEDPEKLYFSNQYKIMGQLASYDLRLNDYYSRLITAINVGSQVPPPAPLDKEPLTNHENVKTTEKIPSKLITEQDEGTNQNSSDKLKQLNQAPVNSNNINEEIVLNSNSSNAQK